MKVSMSISILSFRLQSSALKGLDDSGIQDGRSAANLMDLKLLNFNCTVGRGAKFYTVIPA
jgi:hypothetical protein